MAELPQGAVIEGTIDVARDMTHARHINVTISANVADQLASATRRWTV
jgi:hypothetical protein